ncbi:MAG: hypothetical protein ABIR71_03700 [Chthoniobacterales bacterium]
MRPNFGYHCARAEGRIVRAVYSALLSFLPPVRRHAQELPFEVFSYSGEVSLPEQVASLRSFLRHAGRPRRFTVVSDGTHSARSLALLRAIDPVVAISQAAEWIPPQLPARFHEYLRHHPTGKQLAVIMSLPKNGAAFYIDSDVLFFPGARELVALQPSPHAPVRFLADCQLSADERLFRDPEETRSPVNTGVLFLTHPLDWSCSLERFMGLDGEPTFFTNQTMTHLTMHANDAEPFDAKKWVLQLDDQFVYPDRHAQAEIVLRHYVNPVRHKFWTALWR